MKAVVIGESSGATREAIMAVYPRHKLVVDRFAAQGVVLGIGPFADGGNMAIFKTRDAAEAFVKEDPFILEGLVASYSISASSIPTQAGTSRISPASSSWGRAKRSRIRRSIDVDSQSIRSDH